MGRTKCADSSLVLRGGGRGGKGKEKGGPAVQPKTGFDGRTDVPVRQRVVTFRQPVTIVHTTSRRQPKKPPQAEKVPPNSEKTEKRGRQQVFWAKSLEGLRAMVPLHVADKFSRKLDLNIPQQIELPAKIEIMAPPITHEDIATMTFLSALHAFEQNGTEVIGQHATRKQLEENPFDAMKFTQPLVQIPMITEQDVTLQERRVLDARKRLQELRKSFLIR